MGFVLYSYIFGPLKHLTLSILCPYSLVIVHVMLFSLKINVFRKELKEDREGCKAVVISRYSTRRLFDFLAKRE